MKEALFFICCFSILFKISFGNNANGHVIIDRITIEGNFKTKERLILRELSIRPNDTISFKSIFSVLEKNEQQLFNTGLFLEVEILLKDWNNNHVTAYITVVERWYVFPAPILELADRNFNVWWEEMGRDLSRLDYGIRFRHNNLSGRGDRLKLVTQFGFTQKFELYYKSPYFNKQQTLAVQPFIHFSRTKQIPYATIDNKQPFYEHPDFVRDRFYSGVDFFYRRSINYKHTLSLEFDQNKIGDTVATMNKDFFLEGRVFQRFFELNYSFEEDHRDVRYYPLSGRHFELELNQKGLGIFNDLSMTSITASLGLYKPLGQKVYAASQLKSKISFPRKQPYYNQLAFGYRQDFVRGYELYVIDGQHYSLFKSTVKYQLFNGFQSKLKSNAFSKFSTIPLGTYIKAYLDIGYVHDEYYFAQNPLNNELLIGGGIGVDFVTYYDMVLRVEFSINKLNEKGLFLHFKIDI